MRGAGSIALTLPLLAASLFAAEPAHAVYEMCNPYSIEEFRDQMAAIEKAFDDFDMNEARYQAETAEKQARCITSPVTPQELARFATLRAQMYFFDQKMDNAAEWMLVALSVNGNSFPEDIGPTHPLRLVVRDIDTLDIPPVTFDGHAVPPKRGVVLMNGRLIQKPTSYENVRSLVQVFDRNGEWVEGFWLNGVEFNDSVTQKFVQKGGKPYKVAKWWAGQSHTKAPDLHKELEAARRLDESDIAAMMGDDDDDPGLDIDLDVSPPDEPDPPIPDDEPAVVTDDDDAKSATVAAADTSKPDPEVDEEGFTTTVTRRVGAGERTTTETSKVKPTGDETKADPSKEGTPTAEDPDGKADATDGPAPPPKGKDITAPPPKEKPSGGRDGLNIPILGTGAGLVAVGGGLYGVAAGVANGTPSPGYTSADLRSRRTTANALVVSSGALMLGGAGLGVTAFVGQTQAGFRVGGSW
ncbi:MAG: hypothetical protein EA397_12315 [Deltaproteobacteria bacterium]|nr:MAG: hypothetical protein EA397_12315 [Deltaproteobacteria bacterium]